MLQAKESVGTEMRTATFSVSEAVYAAGDFKYAHAIVSHASAWLFATDAKLTSCTRAHRHKILDGAHTATFRLSTHQENVAGVRLPHFTPVRVLLPFGVLAWVG